MNKKTGIIFSIVVLAGIGAGAYYYFMQNRTGAPAGGQPALPAQTITIGGTRILAEIASTDTERSDGLSGRPSLSDGHGMLFVFPSDGNWGIWMPNMHFPIDIIWADTSGKIVALDAGVSPQTYPNVFYPNNSARYVLEIPAGFAASKHIVIGSNMSLPE